MSRNTISLLGEGVLNTHCGLPSVWTVERVHTFILQCYACFQIFFI